jgi:hypothetical protein
MNNYLSVYANRVRSLVGLLILVPFFCFMTFLAYRGYAEIGIGDYRTMAAVFISLLLFLVILILLYNLCLTRALVVIDEMGIQTFFWSRKALLIKWDEIIGVRSGRKWMGKGSMEVVEIELTENNIIGKREYILPLDILGKGKEKIYGIIRVRVKKGKL